MPETAELTRVDYRKEFADFEDVIYLDVSGQAPLPLESARAAQLAIEWKRLPHKIPAEAYFGLPDRVRSAIARLISADPDDVAVTSGASAGFCAVAAGIDWREGDEILVGRGEFPAHFSTWLALQRRGLVSVKIVEPRERFPSAQDYLDQITPRTRLISASHVRFDDGTRLDASALADGCHRAGAALLLDVSQSAGAVPLNINEIGADFVTGAGYKWLLSPFGTGFFWVRREWSDRLPLGPIYWMALQGAREFHNLPLEGLKLTPGARRWDAPETSSFLNLAAMAASVELVLRIGPENVERHNAALLELLIERLPRDRCVLASPQEAQRRGPYLCIKARHPENTAMLFERLCQAKIKVSFRQGALRIAPYVYNTERDIARLIEVLSV